MDEKHTITESMKRNAKENGYFLCPDAQLFNDLIDGLVINTKRYGYGSCPCRVASGVKKYDGDIICPCEYRDADVDEFGMCFCGLFVNNEMNNTPSQMGPIPERRPQEAIDASLLAAETQQNTGKQKSVSSAQVKRRTPMNVWRCKVCGYLCARENPPPICPICKAKAERFEEFTL